MSVTANGQFVIRGRVTVPRQGAWVADLIVDDPAALFGSCTLQVDGGLTFKGTAERSGAWLETQYTRLAPGANGLKKPAKPKGYRNVALSVIVRDLLAAGGEVLAATSTPALLGVQFPAYCQARDAVGRCLTALLLDRRLVEPVWRCLPDGTVFVGYETWPDSGLLAPGDYQDLDELPHEGRAELGVEAWTLLPGTTLEGRRISAVEHNVDGETVRTSVWFEA